MGKGLGRQAGIEDTLYERHYKTIAGLFTNEKLGLAYALTADSFPWCASSPEECDWVALLWVTDTHSWKRRWHNTFIKQFITQVIEDVAL